MAAGSTYTPIATTTLGSATGTVTFTSIPSTYTDLVLVAVGTAVNSTGWGLQFNSDTASNYSATYVEGNSTSAVSERYGANYMRTCWNSLWNTSNPSNTIIQIQNYSNTTTYKSALWRSNSVSNGYVEAGVGLWRSTTAINRIDIIISSANFATGSTFTLYGILAA
jgi:hypothetical protein